MAEIGSWLVSLETGLPHDPSQHTAYIASWLESLKKDKNEIFRAANAASKAVDFVLKREREQPVIGSDTSGCAPTSITLAPYGAGVLAGQCNLVYQHRIPFIKIGRSLRFDPAEVIQSLPHSATIRSAGTRWKG